MQILNDRKKQVGKIGSFQMHGKIGLIFGVVSLLLLFASLWTFIRNQESVYFLAHPEQVGGPRTPLSDLFEIPVTRTQYTEQLPFKALLENDMGFYFTMDCQKPFMPESLHFSVERILKPRRVHIAVNLREGRSFINGQQLNAKCVGWIALQFDTISENERWTFLALTAGANVREWLIGAADNNADIVRDTTSLDTHEAYYGRTKPLGLTGVIDLISLQVPSNVPDKPLVGIWVHDSSSTPPNDCDPGLQVMGIVVEAPRGPNAATTATSQNMP